MAKKSASAAFGGGVHHWTELLLTRIRASRDLNSVIVSES